MTDSSAPPTAGGSSDADPARTASVDLAEQPPRTFAVEVVANEPMTHDTRLLQLRVLADVALVYRAGQFARLHLPGGIEREYSIANPPPAAPANAQILEFHVRLSNSSTISGSRVIHEQVRTGDTLQVTAPLGDSHWREAHTGPMLLIAGGTGLAPMMSIAEATLASGKATPIYLYLGARDERDVYGEQRLEQLATQFPQFHYEIVLSESSAPGARRIGMVTEALAADFTDQPGQQPVPTLIGSKAYLAGPPPMVESVTRWLVANGVAPADIHGDAY